ncbi:hypothetical protein PF010_g30025 [Phytophthora fragariae]|uniref:Uncharacterized protein n=1 Tax=Phytophthora fragariae TaxID=53985 RepID=A0A6G0MAQ7_9STRA|nr:hypothetical protein PF010_g30025 [Phytophthora fragariae]KAE9160654.1 hypothetical protein PF004_g31103 [Phytophthora fragariae]
MRPLYSASLTVMSAFHPEAALTTVHSGSLQMIALNAPPPRLTRADPSKLATRRVSSCSTVGTGVSTDRRGSL